MKKILIISLLTVFSSFAFGQFQYERTFDTGLGTWIVVPSGDPTWAWEDDDIDWAKISFGTTVTPQDEWLFTDTIKIPGRAADTTFTLTFHWRNDFFSNCNGTFGTLGTGNPVDGYNNADIKVLIKKEGITGWPVSFTTLWQEDDQTLVEAATPGIWPYDDKTWYEAVIDITAYAGDTVAFAFQYEADNPAYIAGSTSDIFGLDTFRIEEIYPEIPDTLNFAVIDEDPMGGYTSIPFAQMQDDYLFAASVVSNGTDDYAYSTFLTIDIDTAGTNIGTFYEELLPADLEAGDSVYVEMTGQEWTPPGINDYTLTYSANFHGDQAPYANTHFTSTFTVNDSIYARDDYASYGGYASADDTRPGFGTIYEILYNDHINSFSIYFEKMLGNTLTFNLSLIEIADMNATSGTLVWTSENFDRGDGDSWQDFVIDGEAEIDAGLYVVMINQLSEDSLKVRYDTTDNGFVIRGDASSLSYDDDIEGYLYLRMNLIPNRAPEYTFTDTVVNALVGFDFSFTIIAEDDDYEALDYFQKIDVPVWLLPDWLTFTDNGDTTATISGKPTIDDVGDNYITTQVTDGCDTTEQIITINVLDVPVTFTEFGDAYENLDSWITIDDNSETGSTEYWVVAGDTVGINPDTEFDQDEWLISDTLIYIPFVDPDTTIVLSFDWKTDFERNAGGTFGTLGTGNPVDGYNYADIVLKISTDNGDTWSAPIWQEDDQTLVEAATPDIEWPYESDTWYTATIDITSYEGELIWFAFQYVGLNGGAFALDTFDIAMIIPEFDLEVTGFAPGEFTQVPLTQLQDYDIEAQIKNIGNTASITTFLSAIITDSVGVEVYADYANISPINDGDSILVTSLDQFTPLFVNDYTLSFEVDILGDTNIVNNTDDINFTVSDSIYAKDDGQSVGGIGISDDEDRSFGNVFEIVNDDYFTGIKVFFTDNPNGKQVSFTLIENATDSTGAVIFNTPVFEIIDDDVNIWVNFDITDYKIDSGTYTLMITQTTLTGNILVGYDAEGSFVRGDYSFMWTDTDTEGNLMMRMVLRNDPPTFLPAINDTVATVGVDFLYNVSAIDDNSDSLTFIVESKPVWVTFENKNDGNRALIKGTPTARDVGSNLVQIGVFDDRDTVRKFFTIDVQESPAPIFLTTPGVIANEGIVYSYTAIGSDPFGDDITVSSEILPSWLSDTVSTDGDTIVVTGTPLAANVGEHQVKLNVTDEFGMTKQQAFEITVKANVAPEFITFGPVEGNEDIIYTFDIVATDDNENDILTITSTTLPVWLTFTDNNDGTALLTGTPLQADVGANAVGLSVTDNLGLSDAQTYTIVVYAVNDAPVFTTTQSNDTLQAGKLFSSTFAVTDVDNDNIMFNTDMPTWLLLTNQGDGQALLRGMPMLEALGSNSVTIVATDGQAEISQTFTIEVIDTTSAPKVAMKNDAKGSTNNLFEFVLDATDDDGDKISFVAEDMPEWLVLTENNGSAMFKGTPMEEGTYSFAVNVSDGLHTVVSVLNIDVSLSITGIEDISGNIKIYPNPASNYITITNVQGSRVSVYNIVGEKVLEIAEVESNEAQIDLSGLNEGTYIINIYHGEEIVLRKVNILR